MKDENPFGDVTGLSSFGMICEVVGAIVILGLWVLVVVRGVMSFFV